MSNATEQGQHAIINNQATIIRLQEHAIKNQVRLGNLISKALDGQRAESSDRGSELPEGAEAAPAQGATQVAIDHATAILVASKGQDTVTIDREVLRVVVAAAASRPTRVVTVDTSTGREV